MPTSEDLLRKISYIEADLDIQRQILLAIPAGQTEEMEKTIATIAARKGEIQALRDQIRTLDPDAHARIVAFELASAQFRQLVSSGGYTQVVCGFDGGEAGRHTLSNGSSIPCLLKAFDGSGNWVVITTDGQILQGTGDNTTAVLTDG